MLENALNESFIQSNHIILAGIIEMPTSIWELPFTIFHFYVLFLIGMGLALALLGFFSMFRELLDFPVPRPKTAAAPKAEKQIITDEPCKAEKTSYDWNTNSRYFQQPYRKGKIVQNHRHGR